MWLLEQINKEEIRKVISYSQNIDNPIIDDLMEKWSNIVGEKLLTQTQQNYNANTN